MNQLSGEATEEKFASVEAKRAEIDEILSSYERQTAAFKNGEMSSEEYGGYLQKFYSAQNEDRCSSRLRKERPICADASTKPESGSISSTTRESISSFAAMRTCICMWQSSYCLRRPL